MNRSQQPHLNVASLSHAGMTGKNNEDRFAVSSYTLEGEKPVLFAVVSDGIGGHRAGEVAAELAVSYIVETVSQSNGRDPLHIMESAIHSASEAIASRSASKQEQQGMGATCACVWVDGERLYIAYVGDSRIYLVRDGSIQRLTIDHTWVQEAVERGIITLEQAHDHPNVHVIRRHLGSVELPDVDTRLRLNGDEDTEQAQSQQGTRLKAGDTLLMCTDGLTDLVWDDEILRLILTRNTLKSAAEDLVEQANERGGHDNITVVLIGIPKRATAITRRKKKGLLNSLLS
ncbi:MAG: PP2C family protein-serine/threonine phosphatase [Anaerolineales bacterium]